METSTEIASIVFAAGKGTRMEGFHGNKTLLPLVPGPSPYQGSYPILIHILRQLPAGPKALVVNHESESVIAATKDFDLTYCFQPLLNGTGGALLCARDFLESIKTPQVIITMGDVPNVRATTYLSLAQGLEQASLVILGFRPKDKKKYGVLETQGGMVRRIIEWEYWRQYPKERQDALKICNSGIYAAGRDDLLQYFPLLKKRPHKVRKERNGKVLEIQEFFITDLVELMAQDGLSVRYVLARDEREVSGVDDLTGLRRAQEIFRALKNRGDT
ncbi:MAG: NTP transferase domain-containing protein [Deltaproteobacteria bacterium]|nr:NTP transferase domain-containing protein [Deltaproteobacteria bacterium]